MPPTKPPRPPAPPAKKAKPSKPEPKASRAPKAPRLELRHAPPTRPRGRWRGWALTIVAGALTGLLAAGGVLFLDAREAVRAWRSSPPQAEPVTVWSAPIRVQVGDPYAPADLRADLLAAGYEATTTVEDPGQFAQQGDTFVVHTAAWKLAGAEVPGGRATLTLSDGHVVAAEPEVVVLRPTRLATVGDVDTSRDPVTQADLPPYVAAAVLAIEDARFQTHVGVDPLGVLRAILHDLKGEDLHGGSSLTQQLAKNLFTGPERTLRRKVREAFLALALESELDKQQLLDLYLSEVYLGSSGGVPLHGVEQAARAWFGKSAKSLSVAEAASIAGTIASPNVWSPLRAPKAGDDPEAHGPSPALRRRDTVIDRMVAVRALTAEQAAAAKAEPLAVRGTPPSAAWRLPWAVDAALEEAEARLGGPVPAGAAVHTTVQPHLQRAAQAAVKGALTTLAEHRPAAVGAEGALVAVDASDGDVVAIVGGRDWLKSPFHRALHAERQAGSTVKPLLLAAALDADPTLSLGTVLDDAPLERKIGNKVWRPKDHDGLFLGPMTVRRAIELSRNVPAVLLSERLGLGPMADAFAEAGLVGTTKLPSAALGAFPTNAVQLAGAYTVFPGGGTAQRPHVVHAVVGPDEAPLLQVRAEAVKVVSPTAAGLTTSVLQGVLSHGTAKKVADLGVPPEGFGGKTGTTDQGRDAWFVGFDARLVVAVWVGADRGDLGLGGSEAALPVWAAFARDAGRPRGRLGAADGLVDVEVCASTGLPACPDCAERRTERFRADAVPAPACDGVTPPPPEAPAEGAAPPSTEAALEAPAPSGSVQLEPVRRGPRSRLPQPPVGEAGR